jgi:hypothetical protein
MQRRSVSTNNTSIYIVEQEGKPPSDNLREQLTPETDMPKLESPQMVMTLVYSHL